MKVEYRVEIHKEKGKKDKRIIRIGWKDKKSDSSPQFHINYCCDEMKNAFDRNFISIQTTQISLVGIKHDEKQNTLNEPLVCLDSYNEDGWGDCDSCPHEEMSTPIKFCPFCRARITLSCNQTKNVFHNIKKIKRTYEEKEDKTTEEIIS